MIKLKKLQAAKAKARAEAAVSDAVNNTSSITSGPSVAFLRAKRDLQEYEDIPCVCISYAENDPMHIELVITPDSGYYKGGKFTFQCTIPESYPHSSPEFRCLEKIYHPNIDVEGHVCLNILRNDWKPTLTLQLIFAGILHLFLHPNPNDPLNKDAANDLAKFPEQFKRHVQQSMSGGYISGEKFDNVIVFTPSNAQGRYDRRYDNFY